MTRRPGPESTTSPTSRLAGAWPYVNLLTLFGLAFAQPILDLLSRHPAFFVARRLESAHVLGLVAVLYLLLPIPVLLLSAALGRIAPRARALFDRAVTWALLSTIALRVAKIVGWDAGSWTFLGAGLAAAAVVWALARFEGPKLFLNVFAISLLVTPAMFLLDPQVSKIVFSRSGVEDGFYVTGVDTPIFWLVFDELPTSTLLDGELEINAHRYPSLARLAGDSVWFENAAAVSESTHLALPAMLSGLEPDRSRLPMLADYPQNLFTIFGDYDLVAYEAITRLCPPERNRFTSPDLGAEDPFEELVRDLPIVFGHLVLPAVYARDLPPVTQNWRGFRETDEPALQGLAAETESQETESQEPGSADPESQEPEKKPTMRDFVMAVREVIRVGDRPETFHRFVDRIGGRGTLHFNHMLLPHGPWAYFPSGEVYKQDSAGLPGHSDRRWHDDEWYGLQSFQRHIFQTQYTDRLLGELLEKIDDAGLYDESLIVVMSDHGVSFRPGALRRDLDDLNGPDMVPSLFLLKRPGQKEPERVSYPVTVNDALPTVLDVLGIPPPDGLGRSAFDPAYSETFEYEIMVNPDKIVPYPKTVFDDMRRWAKRKIELFGDGSDPEDIYGLGTRPDLHGRTVEEIGAVEPVDGSLEIEGAVLYHDLDEANLAALSRISGAVDLGADGCVDVAIAIDGRIEATTRTYPGAAGCRGFSGFVPRDRLRVGRNDVRAYVIDEVEGKIVLRGSDEPEDPGREPRLRISGGVPEALIFGDAVGGDAVGGDGARVIELGGALRGRIHQFERFEGRGVLTGWAIDHTSKAPPGRLLLFGPDGEFLSSIGSFTERRDIAERFGAAYSRSGFRFYVPESRLEGVEQRGLSVVAVSKDGDAASWVRPLYRIETEGEGPRIVGSDGLSLPVRAARSGGLAYEAEDLADDGWRLTFRVESASPPSAVMVFRGESYVYTKRPDFQPTDGGSPSLEGSVRIPKNWGFAESLDELRAYGVRPDGVAEAAERIEEP